MAAIHTHAGASTAWRQWCIYGAVAALSVPLFAAGLIPLESEDLTSVLMFLIVASQSVVLIALVIVLLTSDPPGVEPFPAVPTLLVQKPYSSLFRSSICLLASDLYFLLFLAVLSTSPSNVTSVCALFIVFSLTGALLYQMDVLDSGKNLTTAVILPIVVIFSFTSMLFWQGRKGIIIELIVLIALAEIGYASWFTIKMLQSRCTFGFSSIAVAISVFFKALVKVIVLIWVGLALATPTHNHSKTSLDYGMYSLLEYDLTSIVAFDYIGESLLALSFAYFFVRFRSTAMVIPSSPWDKVSINNS